MNDEEKEKLTWQAIRRLKELFDSAGPLENGKPLPPDVQAEIELVYAKGAILGLAPESAAPMRQCACGQACRCDTPPNREE